MHGSSQIPTPALAALAADGVMLSQVRRSTAHLNESQSFYWTWLTAWTIR